MVAIYPEQEISTGYHKMNYSIIQKSRLEGSLRLDAEYYQPEYLQIDNKLSKNTEFLNNLAEKIICGPFGSAILNSDYKKEGVPLVRVSNLNNLFVQDENLVFIDQDLSGFLKKYQVEKDDIVVSQRGTVALFSKITEYYPKWNISANLISIKKSTKINFDYLLAFLNSKFGISQLIRRLSGQVQPKITTDDIKQIKIFLPDKNVQQKIGSLISLSKCEIENSKILSHKAESLLLGELGLEAFDTEQKLTSLVNLSDCQKANRIDAEYFESKYLTIQTALSKTRLSLLSKNFEILRGEIIKYSDTGNVGVIKTKQLGKQYINFDVEDKTDDDMSRGEKLPTLSNNDILFASMGVGSLGKANIYYEFENNGQFTIDSTLKIFRAKKGSLILPEVLQVFLSSYLGRELIYQNIVGSSGIISIYEHYIKNLPVPILPKHTQEKIADLVRKSHESRKKSKELLEEAKRKVEEMIGNKYEK